jgi:hypothetical protein
VWLCLACLPVDKVFGYMKYCMNVIGNIQYHIYNKVLIYKFKIKTQVFYEPMQLQSSGMAEIRLLLLQ